MVSHWTDFSSQTNSFHKLRQSAQELLSDSLVAAKDFRLAVPVRDGVVAKQLQKLKRCFPIQTHGQCDHVRADDGSPVVVDAVQQNLESIDGLVLIEGLGRPNTWLSNVISDAFHSAKITAVNGWGMRHIANLDLSKFKLCGNKRLKSTLTKGGAGWQDALALRHKHLITGHHWTSFVDTLESTVRQWRVAKAIVFSDWFDQAAESFVRSRVPVYDVEDYVGRVRLTLFRRISLQSNFLDSFDSKMTERYLRVAIKRIFWSHSEFENRRKHRSLMPNEDQAEFFSIENNQLSTKLLESLRALSQMGYERERSILELRYLGKMQVKDIAEQFNVTPRSIKRWEAKGCALLAKLMKD